MMGKLVLILGPMYSGKTSYLLKSYERSLIANKKTLLIKHSSDNRYSHNKVCTHDNNVKTANLICNNLMDNIEDALLYQNVFIDEGQFYKDNIDEFCNILTDSGINVYISALNGDYQRKIFENVALLIQCNDNRGSYTHRISCETDKVLIGGIDKYVTVCRKCYNLKN
jgi:thymidine kinase